MKHISSTDKTVVMSGQHQSSKSDAEGNANHQDSLDEENNHSSPYDKEQPLPPIYWSVIHHKNLRQNVHEDVPTSVLDKQAKGAPTEVKKKKAQKLPSDIPREVIHEGEPFLAEVSSRSALTGYGSTTESPRVSPPTLPPENTSSSGGSRGWGKLREAVESKELFIRHIAEKGDEEENRRWSDLNSSDYELDLHDCIIMHAALLTVGVIAYSFVFENWTIIDSIYFSTVLLTTVGYGDMAPTTVGGKLFGTIFSLGGVVVIGLALGIVGSRLVEAEIKTVQKVRTKTSKALELAFTRRSRHRLNAHKQGENENTAYSTETERSLTRSCSSASLESLESIGSTSTCSSVYDPDSSHTHSRRSRRRHRGKKKEEPKQFPAIVLFVKHLPGFTPLVVLGLVMALLERWRWYDCIYYCIVTGTTIGFGDLAPHREVSKALAILFVPIAVASMGYILGNIATFIVDRRRSEYTKKLWASEMKLEDLEALDEAGDGGVSELEYIKFMLVAMKKIDAELFDDLRDQFDRLDLTRDGKITKKDLTIMATRRVRRATHKLKLRKYKNELQEKSGHKRRATQFLFDKALNARYSFLPNISQKDQQALSNLHNRETSVHKN